MVTIRIGDTQEDLTWQQWEDRVSSGRIPADALVRFEPVTGAEFRIAGELDIFQSLDDESRRTWADEYRSGSPPWMTALIAGGQIRLWWLVATAGAVWAVDSLQLFQPFVYEDGQVWRIVTAGLTHSDLGHIASNLVMFVYVGWFLERALGRFNLLVIFLASVIGGSVLSITMTPGTGSIGSSGGVLGIVAAATVFGFVRFGLLPPRARIIFGWALLPYLALIFGMGWFSETTDNWAHTGGLVTGAILALLLDPPGLQRRRFWNGMVWSTAGVGTLAIMGTMFFAGPYLIQTADVDRWNTTAKDRRIYDDLDWTAPTTWRRSASTGQGGFASQADPRRFWAVRTRTKTRPATATAELADWRDDVRADWAEHATFSEPTPSTLGGHDATSQTVLLGDPPTERREHRVSIRGSHVLAATWSVDLATEIRLAPVRDSLFAEVVWREPAALVKARDAVDRKPKSRPFRRRLAGELALTGEVAEAKQVWEKLVEERPSTPDGWVGLLDLLRVHPDQFDNPDALLDRALTSIDSPEVQAAVALAIWEDRPDTSRGVLEAAWASAPGDRHLRRARKSIGLPTALVDLTPAHWEFDPRTGAPRDETRTVVAPQPLNMASAAELGASLRNERNALIEDALANPGPRGIAILTLLRHGQVPVLEDLGFELRDTARDLSGLEAGRDVSWLDHVEEERLLDLTPITSETVGALVPPDAEQTAAFGPYLETLGLIPIEGPQGPVLQRY